MATGIAVSAEEATVSQGDSFILKESQLVTRGEVVMDPKDSKNTFRVVKIHRLFGKNSLVILEGKDVDNNYRSMTLNPASKVLVLA
jgi:hypothetical protein